MKKLIKHEETEDIDVGIPEGRKIFWEYVLSQKNLRGLSPRANYTDRTTTPFWRS
jgi:hypothetical protein